jgi:hypothetical protein
MALRFLAGSLSYLSEAELIITRFEREGDEVKLDVWLKDKFFEGSFMIGSFLIKESGNWKWYGNQIP